MEDKKPYIILHLEDDPNDAELVNHSLQHGDLKVEVTVTANKDAFIAALVDKEFDAILLDFDTPSFTALDAIKYIHKHDINTPVIVVSGAIGDEQAVKIIKQGAVDYVLKDNLIRLPAAVKRAIKEYHYRKRTMEQDKLHTQLIHATHAGIFKLDPEGRCFYMNQQLKTMLGFKEAALWNYGWLRCIYEEDKDKIQEEWQAKLKSLKPFQIEYRIRNIKGEVIWIKCHCSPETNKNNELTGYIGTIIDITDLKDSQLELIQAARFDSLTDLPNRRLLLETLSSYIEEIQRHRINIFALLYIDLDHFKKVNDTLGHGIGDKLLIEASKRLKKLLRKSDFIARVGGDEFIILAKNIKNMQQVTYLCDRILESFQEPFIIENNDCNTTVSIGVVIMHHNEQRPTEDDVIQHGDLALYRAKGKGRNRVEYYTDEINQEINRTVSLENDLRNAIKNEELSLVYQPQICIDNDKVIGCEVLLRWEKHNEMIPPDLFIPIAEETKLIVPISEWIIDNAFRQFSDWQDTVDSFDDENFCLSINLSPAQFEYQYIGEMVDYLNLCINKYRLDPNTIIFELTETAIMSNIEKMKEIFNAFSEQGFKVAIDDFGTGYSSLSYLKELPLKMLKIDKAFVQDIETDGNSRAISKGIISLASALNLEVIAEGVETKDQLEYLKENNCKYVQGYYFAKPLTPDDFVAFINQRNAKNT